MYTRERSLREDRVPQRRKTPSFSSSLLDAIYRSIDEPNGTEEQSFLYPETTTRNLITEEKEKELLSLERAVLIEKRRESQRNTRTSTLVNSSSSSSDSSSGGPFSSSSETESSSYRGGRSSSTSSCFTPRRQKPVLTDIPANKSYRSKNGREEEGFTKKTRLKALKLYSDLKKANSQPISPGRRIASFLVSLFNAKKEKVCSDEVLDEIRAPELKPKTDSSFSRSCLSKTPPSTGKLSNGMKRSVKFFPVSVVVDEDCRPRGQKCLYEHDPSLMPVVGVKKVAATTPLNRKLKSEVKEQKQRVKVQDLMRGYHNQKKTVTEFRFRDIRHEDTEEEEEDDDAESCASSDLFELENLSRYREELPVYETTNLKTNQAIANGLIL